MMMAGKESPDPGRDLAGCTSEMSTQPDKS